jgi:3-phenylpropionate/trans-cinnamate dioxygenase ferredoxin subunit
LLRLYPSEISNREIKMEFVKVLNTSDLPLGKMTKVVMGNQEVLIANVAGSYYAIANKCNHLGGSLANGKLVGSIVTCPWHGAQYDVKTGQAVREAKIAFLKMKVKDEEGFTVKVEGQAIMIGR